MWPFLRDLLLDKDAFTSAVGRFDTVIRSVIGMVALAIVSGAVNIDGMVPPKWIGILMAGAAWVVRGGEKNVPVLQQVKDLPPPEKQQLKQSIMQ